MVSSRHGNNFPRVRTKQLPTANLLAQRSWCTNVEQEFMAAKAKSRQWPARRVASKQVKAGAARQTKRKAALRRPVSVPAPKETAPVVRAEEIIPTVATRERSS